MDDITAKHFHNPDAAREYLEAIRWPDGPVCPHCGVLGDAYRLEGKGGEKGKKARAGLLKCGACRKQFSVTVGTVFERSKIGLHKWLLASYLLCSSKKGISSHQLHRTLGVTYKTAWFMAHRIREAMRETSPSPLGGGDSVVEVDEVYIGGSERHKRGPRKPDKAGRMMVADRKRKAIVVTLVERGGRARSFHVPDVTSKNIRRVLFENVSRASTLMTDEAQFYKRPGRSYEHHESVNHSAFEYVRGDASTNTVEGYFSILRRGLNGIYQHVSEEHLKRYICEFDFRYSNRDISDAERNDAALKGIDGKRLTYRQPSPQVALG